MKRKMILAAYEYIPKAAAQPQIKQPLQKAGLYKPLRQVYWQAVGIISKPMMRVDGTKARFHVDGVVGGPANRKYRGFDDYEQEGPVLRDALANVKDGDTFYDVGSHSGIYTCLVGQKTQYSVAFDVDSSRADLCSRNMELNNIRGDSYAFMIGDGDTGIRMEEVVEKEELPEPSVMKIDVEGMEYAVIDGCGDLLNTIRIMYVEIHKEKIQRCPGSVDAVHRLLDEHGFDIETIHGRGEQVFIKAMKGVAT